MKNIVFLLICLSGVFFLSAQNDSSVPVFPDSWVGDWSGDLMIYSAEDPQVFPMQLKIHPTDEAGTYSWTIIYGEGEMRSERPYFLLTKDAKKGHYAIDEKNSILLDAYLKDQSLLCRFQVGGSMLLTENELRGEEMYFQIIAGNLEPIGKTGGEEINGDEIPEVLSYPVGVMQKAILKRK